MIEEHIHTNPPYTVRIGSGILPQAGRILLADCPDPANRTAVIVSDSHVMPLYGQTAAASFEALGCRVLTYEIPAGEQSKSWPVLGSLLEYLAENHLRRCDFLVALGGGVVGDLTGFAASIYLRGIAFYQIPTTLLADVDSSVGGKTAVDLTSGKNLAGTFWQPRGVVCDLETLQTLPDDIFLDGVAESIKYGILRDRSLFDDILNGGLGKHPVEIVAACTAMKGSIV